VLIDGNTFTGNSGAGLLLVETVDVIVRDNVFSRNTGGGLGLGQSDRIWAVNNVFDRNYLGGVLWAGSTGFSGSGRDTAIESNRFMANGGDIDLVETAKGTINANLIEGGDGYGGGGIFFRHARDLSLAANNVSAHAGGGLTFWYSSNVTLHENAIRDNNAWGLYLYSSQSFLVQNNEFIKNWQQVTLDTSSGLMWDGGYPLGGNHWSDYTGLDRCGGSAQNVCASPDGFGDTPYAVNSTNEDRYPMMRPRGLPSRPPVASLVPEPRAGNATTRFELNASLSWDLNESSSRLEFRWDWESDGTWDTDWSKQSVQVHRYNLSGVHSPRVQVRDSENRTDDATTLVAVVGVNPAHPSPIPLIVATGVIASVAIALGVAFFVTTRRRRPKDR